MRGSLAVRLADGVTDRVVTRRTSGLRFRKTAPGGHHSASCQVNVPRSDFPRLGPADKLYVSDTRNGTTIWEGYTESPGALDGPGGQGFDLAAMGGMVLLQDQSRPFVFVETSVTDDLWVTSGDSGGTDRVIGTAAASGSRDYLLQFSSGQPVATGSKVSVTYTGLKRAGLKVAFVRVSVVSGKVDAGYSSDLVLENSSVEEIVRTSSFSTTSTTHTAPIVTAFPVAPGYEQVLLRVRRTGAATNVADDVTSTKFSAVIIKPVLKSAAGVNLTAADSFSTLWVRGSEVVNHLLGAALPLLDGANARVDTTLNNIEQLTYHDGAKPIEVLEGLSLYEPEHFYEVLETNQTGKHKFAYRIWPTTPRYEVSVRDGYTAPGGDVDLCNRVVVYWTDSGGGKQSTVVTQNVPELGTRTRDADPVTLPTGVGNAADASKVGQSVLAAKTATAPRAATMTIRRPIVDQMTQSTVMPWEIEPGYLVRVRETGEDLRLTEMEYTDDSCSAQLTLGTPAPTVEQINARVFF